MATNDLLIRLLARDQASPVIKNVSQSLSGLSGATKAVTGALGAFGVALGAAGFARFSAEAVTMAASAEQIESAFRNLSASAGLSANTLLTQLERVAGGVATNAQLMQTANLALQGGTVELVQQLPRLFEVARAAAVASGQDVLYVYDTLVRGIIRGSPLLIDNANIFVKIGDAQEQFAASIGKTVEELSAQEKQLSLLNAVMGDADRIIKATGIDSESAAANIKSMSVATAELKTAWGELLLAMGVSDAIGNMAQAMRDLTDEAGRANFGKLLTELNALVGELERAGKGKEAGELARQIDAIRLSGLGLDETNARLMQLRAAALGLDPTKVGAMADSIADLVALRPQLAAMGEVMRGMSLAGPISPLLQNQSTAKGLSVDEWVQGMTDAITASHDVITQDAEDTALDYSRSWESAFNDVRNMAESVLRSGLQVTPLDMAQTAAGTYQDKPLEAARRLADIANLGLESPWAKFFEIPPDVMAAGSEAIKAWASEVQGDVENLTRPDLIDWDAFVSGFQQAQQDAAAQELTLDIAVGKLAQAGLLDAGTKNEQRAQVAKMLGIETPELAAAGITAGFRAAFEADNPAVALLNSFTTKNSDSKAAYETAGKASGKVFGKQVHDAALAELDPFMDDLAGRVLQRLPKAGEVPP